MCNARKINNFETIDLDVFGICLKFVCYEKLFTLDNLRMKSDDWFIDKTVFGSEIKTVEVCIGKNFELGEVGAVVS